MKICSSKFILWAYTVASMALLLYSYTQVDLSLTLSKFSIYQIVEKEFQHIGYYQRPLSTALYLSLLCLFFLLYGCTLWAARGRKLSFRAFWWVVGVMTVILVFSYPAFSYDMFNYMFTAKTVLVYHQNPYTVIPLQFTGVEPWLSFMHWTHLPSAYTPFWILLSLPAYLLGFGYFLGIMWSIKILVAGFYILTVLTIGKILTRLDPDRAMLGMAIFAFNPLVIFETLVSGHNDIVMMACVMIAYYLYLTKKRWASFFLLSLSVAGKLMTIFIVPIFFLGWQRTLALFAMIVGLAMVLTQRTILPWYMIWVIPFYALIPDLEWAIVIGSGLSLGLLLSYVPFLYTGGYAPPIPTIMNVLIIIPTAIAAIWAFVQHTRFARQSSLRV